MMFNASRIEDLCTRVTSGSTPLRSKQEFYAGGTFDWFKTGELGDWFLDSSVEKVTQRAFDETSLKLFPAGTVLMAMYGDGRTITSLGMLRSAAASNQACAAMIVDGAKCDPMYFFYALKSHRHLLIGLALGGAQRNLSAKIVKNFCLPVPAMPLQRRIAGILSAYDDLIENCQRRIRILEDMARSLYREWFVNFRYPGHDGGRMVESGLGLVPDGWQAKPVGALLAHSIGGGWGQEVESDEFSVPAYVIRGTDISDVRLGSLGRSPRRFHTASNFRSRKLQGRDIVFEVSGGSKDQPVGRTVMVGEVLLARADAPVMCASFCRLVRADAEQILPELLQLHFERIYESREIMQYQTQSTGITNFKFTMFLEKEVVVQPPATVQAQFAAIVRPKLQLAESLGIKCAVLRTTRDLLLPRLLSGQIRVEGAAECLQDEQQAMPATPPLPVPA